MPKYRILSYGLAVCLLLTMALYLPGPVEVSATNPGGYGNANGGIDFDTLVGNGIYYGTYDHAVRFQNDEHGDATYEGADRPVLWRVMGEEEPSGNLTLLSEYVLDSAEFNPNSNFTHIYEGSSIMNTLATMSGNIFQGVESAYADSTTVRTRMHNSLSGVELTETQRNATYPAESTGQTLYLPWGKSDNNMVHWDAGADEAYQLAAIYSNNAATLRNGTPVCWWLRSPYSGGSSSALYVGSEGPVYIGYVYFANGVRPAFQINPSSIIFISEIQSGASDPKETEADGTNYFTGEEGRKNFKLTVVGDNNGADVGTLTCVPTILPNDLKTGTTLWLNLESDKTTADGDYTVNYKIVNNSGTRSVQGYGFSGAEEYTALEIDASGLSDGSYTVYVWLQKNNEIYSHEGTMPQKFTLTVDGSGDTYSISAHNPSTGGVEAAGSIVVLLAVVGLWAARPRKVGK